MTLLSLMEFWLAVAVCLLPITATTFGWLVGNGFPSLPPAHVGSMGADQPPTP